MKNYFAGILMGAAIVTMTATSCSKGMDFDENAIENSTKATFTENFKQAYPGLDLNTQSWDLSSPVSNVGLGSFANMARTRGAIEYKWQKMDTLYVVEKNTLEWLKQELPDQKNHFSKGHPFYMTVPSNNFYIIPIYQGRANAKWDLHMVVDGTDINVWKKHEDMEVQSAKNKEWHSITEEDGSELMKCSENATASRCPQYYFKDMPVGTSLYFYLDITLAGSPGHSLGEHMNSINNQMILLDCPENLRPTNIPGDWTVQMIGCEDIRWNHGNCDKDYNDVVFLIVGEPDAPTRVDVTGDTPILETRTVRYLIEDLGSTNDFDFNDIVVDVIQTRETTPIINNDGFVTSWANTAWTQKAIIRHLGGQLPFILKIGDTELPEHKGVMGSNPNEEFEVTGWNPDTHNITCMVQQKESNGMRYNTVAFPKAGEAPMIIAVSPAQEWMPERQSIPAEWFTVPEDAE